MASHAGLEPRLRAILSPHKGSALRARRHHIVWTLLVAGLTLIPFSLVRANVTERPVAGKLPPNPGATSDGKWIRRLPGSVVTLELVGVSSRHDADRMPPQTKDLFTGKPLDDRLFRLGITKSWSPDGTVFPHRLYSRGSYQDMGAPDPARRVVELAFRFQGAANASAKISSLESWVQPPTMIDGKGLEERELNGEVAHPADIWHETVRIPVNQKSLHVRLQAASGAFPSKRDVNVAHDPLSGAASGDMVIGGQKIGLTSSPFVYDEQGNYGFVVTNSNLPAYDTHVVAVDRLGKVVEPREYLVFANDKCAQTTVFFDPKKLPRNQIAKLRFEARPFQTIEFDDIAAFPGRNAR